MNEGKLFLFWSFAFHSNYFFLFHLLLNVFLRHDFDFGKDNLWHSMTYSPCLHFYFSFVIFPFVVFLRIFIRHFLKFFHLFLYFIFLSLLVSLYLIIFFFLPFTYVSLYVYAFLRFLFIQFFIFINFFN